jgi:hypothetical protein
MPGHRHPTGQLAFLEARHRAHARLEDRLRTAKQAGWTGSVPRVTINAVWLQLALTAADLIAWTQTNLLDGAMPGPSRNCRATDCFTPPPGSSTAAAALSSRWQQAGPGPTNSPSLSAASPASDNPRHPG